MLPKKKLFKNELPAGELNVVSLMDILTTLLFFLLIAASFTRMAGLDASGFLSNKVFSDSSDKRPTFSLQVIILNDHQAGMYLGPVAGLRIIDSLGLSNFLRGGEFQGDPLAGFSKKIEAENYKALIAKIQGMLVPIKKSFPHEHTAVVAFTDGITYQQMIDMVTAVRSLEPNQEGFLYKNAVGQIEKTKILFPQVVISEWSEGA